MIFKQNANLCIVIPDDATDREQFAAKELQRYLNKIFGASLSIYSVAEAPCVPMLLIGCPRRNTLTQNYISVEEFDTLVPGPEGFLIKSFGDNLVLAGSCTHPNELERGTIYAVYEFLEKFLGCSLAAYAKQGVSAGEYVPTYESLELTDICHVKACADIPYRTACAQYSAHGKARSYDLDFVFLDWLCKNRYNYIYTWNNVYENFKENGMLAEAVKRGIIFKVGHHDAIDTLLPPHGNKYFAEHYYETHPEYYKMMEDGTRYEMLNGWGQMVLCSRNEDMIEQLAQNFNDWFSQNPQVKKYGFSCKDGVYPQCCCEKCKGHSKIENFTYMLNEVAKRVKPVHPHVEINFCAYADLWEPPTNFVPESNLTVHEAVWYRTEDWTPELAKIDLWHSSGLRTVGKPDGSCLAGTFYEDNLLKWKALGMGVNYYDYFMGVYPARQRYIPMADEMQAMCKRFMEKGISGCETQLEVYNVWNNIFNFYTYGRTAYDTNKSMDDNLEYFCRIFGKGAPYVAENIRYAESVLDGQSDIMYAGLYLMQNIDKERMYDGFEKALEAADTPLTRNNIRLMRMAFRYSDLECRERFEDDEMKYKALKHYDIPERGELFYMRDNFDSYVSGGGYGIIIPVDGNDMDFEPDYWYLFE